MLSCRHLFLVRNVGALSEAAAERNVLARSFVERDHEIVRGDLRGCDDAVVQGLQQGQSLRLRPACDERDLQQDQVVRIGESEERPRVAELRWRQDVDDLKDVVRSVPQADVQEVLDSTTYSAEHILLVAA